MTANSGAVPVNKFDELEITFGDFQLRQMNVGDEALILEKYNEELIQRWMNIPVPFEKKNFENWLRFVTGDQERGTGIWWVIEQGGVAQGQIWFKQVNWAQKIAEVGYLAFAEARGKGMVPFLARKLAELGLQKYGFNRIEIICECENLNSGKAALKAGFTFEGVLRKRLVSAGQSVDVNIYSMIASDLN